MTNNKQKGKRVERQAAKLLTEKTGVEWKRTVFSGAMSTHRDNVVYKGDVHCTDETSGWSNSTVEVKARKNSIKLQELFNPDSKLSKYVEQAISQVKHFNEWILLVKVNYEGWFLLADGDDIWFYIEEFDMKNCSVTAHRDDCCIGIARFKQ